MNSAVFGWSIIGALLLPLVLAKPLRSHAMQRRLRQHGRWLVPFAWLFGVAMVVASLALSSPGDHPALRGLKFALCLAGPLLIGLVGLAVRDARRAGQDLPLSVPGRQVVPRWVRYASGTLCLLFLAGVATQVLSGDWSTPLSMVVGALLFGYVALTGRAGSLSHDV